MASGEIIAAEVRDNAMGSDSLPYLDAFSLRVKIKDWATKTGIVFNSGWTAPNTSRGNIPGVDTPKVIIGLDRAGFDLDDGEIITTTRPRVVWGSTEIRKPYPNGDDLQTLVDGDDLWVDVALEGYVFGSDTNLLLTVLKDAFVADDSSKSLAVSSLPVTNSSTKAQPKVKGSILSRSGAHNRSLLGPTLVDAVHGESYGGVRLVKFTLKDESENEVSQIVEEPTVIDCERRGDTDCKGYAWISSLSTTSLTQGEVATERVQVFPVDGDPSSVFDSDDYDEAGKSWHLRTKRHRIDHDGTWPKIYAYVNPANPSGSPAVSEDPATARTTPFAHIWQARQALVSYIEDVYEIEDSLYACFILLMDNSGADQYFVWGSTGFAATATTPGAALVIEPDPMNTGYVRFRTRRSSTNERHLRCAHVVIRVPFEPLDTNQSSFFRNATTDDHIIFDMTSLKSEHTGADNAPPFYTNIANVQLHCCKLTDWYSQIPVGCWPEIIGWEVSNGFSNSGRLYAGVKMIAGENCWKSVTQPVIFANSVEVTDRRILFGRFVTDDNPFMSSNHKRTNELMQGVFAGRLSTSVSSQALIEISTENSAAEDCLWQDCSLLGARSNVQNSTTNSTFDRHICQSIASPYWQAPKHDEYENDGTLVGMWSTLYSVGYRAIYNGNNSIFEHRFQGLSCYAKPNPVDPADRDPKVVDIDSDPTPTQDSELVGLIYPGMLLSKRFDLAGREVPNDGTGCAGCLQRPSTGRRRSRIF
ncbi:MAG: hypothetical protein ACIAQF_11120 [Phycisphaerales bacterium JB065]